MRHAWTCRLLLAGVAGAACGQQAGEPTASAAAATPAPPAFDTAAFTAAVDALAAEALARGPVVGLSIAVAREGDVVLAKGYGHADREAALPATPDSSYPVASLTKMFTAAAVLQLAERGALSIDEPLGRMLPEARGRVAEVPLRHFLNHTSGVALQGGPSPRSRALRALRAGLASAPGTEWDYSNAGFALLGLVVERASGASYADYVRQMAASAGLTSTGYCEGGAAVPNRVRDYGVSAKGLQPSTYWQHEKFFAAGGLCSSVTDLLRWDRALEEGRVVRSATLQAMRTPTLLPGGIEIGYGLGTRLGHTGRHAKLGHTGGGTSNKAVLARYPGDAVTIAVVFNTEAYNARVTAMEVEDGVARALFGLASEAPADVKLPLEQLRRYAGTYSELGRTTRVVVQEQAQRLHAAGFGPLLPQGGDSFLDADDPGVTLRFLTSGGRVQGYLRENEGWFVEFGRRVGDAGPDRSRARRRRAPRPAQ